jgi:hypothetical protein
MSRREIEKPRSPRGLRKFVCCRREKVNKSTAARHAAIQRKGLYNVFIKEIVPLSIFSLKAYPNSWRVEPVLGNQGYDAIVRDQQGNIVDYVELTFPDDWEAESRDAKLISSRGYGACDVSAPGADVERLYKFIQAVCLKKAQKDYSNCTLVIVIAFWPPPKQFRALYMRKVRAAVNQVRTFSFKAKRVFLLLLEQHKIIEVH